MERQKVLQYLEEQLMRLKNEYNVVDLMMNRRLKELEEIAEKLDFSLLNQYYEQNEKLGLEICEIPEGYHYELAFYFGQSKIQDNKIFKNYEDFIELLKETEEGLALKIAKIMGKWDLCSFEIGDFIW